MQLDRTEIVIRERQFFDVVDLALPILRSHFVGLVIAIALGAIPCSIVNHLLIGWMASPETVEYDLDELPYRYAWNMSLLIALEAPLASTFATVYLGRAVFLERPSIKQLARDVLRLTWPLFVCHGLIRGIIPAWLLMYGRSFDSDLSPGEVSLIMLTICVLLLRAFRPFINEIILLEQNPLRAKNPQQQSIAKRSERLHGGGEHATRWFGSFWIATLLAMSVVHASLFMIGFLFGDWRWTPWKAQILLPASLWFVVAYMTVVRFLNYLDTRIRQEGWEVELKMRAELARLIQRYPSLTGILLLALMSCASPALAGSDPVESVSKSLSAERLPWYDPQTDELKPANARMDRAEDFNRQSKWDKKLLDPNLEVPEMPAWKWPSIGEIFSGLLQGLVYAAIAVLVVFLVYLMIRYFLRRDSLATSSVGELEEPADTAAEHALENLPFPMQRPLTDLLSAANACYERGEFGQAIVFYFSYQLVELDRHQRIRLTRGKTNRQYLRELREQPELSAVLSRTMVAFESYFFGHHPLDRSTFEECWRDRIPFQQGLAQVPQ